MIKLSFDILKVFGEYLKNYIVCYNKLSAKLNSNKMIRETTSNNSQLYNYPLYLYIEDNILFYLYQYVSS